VIFCDGIESFTNPYFSRLPFAPNKGEALIVEIPNWVGQAMFSKKGLAWRPGRRGYIGGSIL